MVETDLESAWSKIKNENIYLSPDEKNTTGKTMFFGRTLLDGCAMLKMLRIQAIGCVYYYSSFNDGKALFIDDDGHPVCNDCKRFSIRYAQYAV